VVAAVLITYMLFRTLGSVLGTIKKNRAVFQLLAKKKKKKIKPAIPD